MAEARATLLRLFETAIAAVEGEAAVARALAGWTDPAPDRILAVGKAAAAMTRAACARFPDVPALVVTKDGHGSDLPAEVTLIEAAHPVPDARSLAAGAALRAAVEAMSADSRLLLLVSGGASALAEDLRPGTDLEDLSRLNSRLLASGLDIGAMNTERGRVSRIKGGGLLSGFKGQSAVTLAISDVPRDDIAVIGSGIGLAPDPRPFDWHGEIVASNRIARDAAAAEAGRLGIAVLGSEETLYDNVSALARTLGAELRAMPTGLRIWGGEPTIVLPDAPGEGGRNQALALELAREIRDVPGLSVLVAGTDGTDGPTDAAGAVVDGTTWGPGAAEALAAADSGRYLEARGARVVTGPTGTNVMDLALALREPEG